jgi:hypothetical protein
LDWSAIQVLFEKAESDVLLLLDCCAAASAAPLGGRAITETIGACGWEEEAPKPGRWSFTSALIDVLKDWYNKSFSAAMLHSKLLSVLKHEQPERIGPKRQKVECRRTPFYTLTTNDLRNPSIDLTRKRLEKTNLSGNLAEPKNGKVANTSKPTLEDTYNTYAENIEELISTTPSGNLKLPHVLISIALAEDQVLDSKSCSNWLAAFPALAKYVKVQGVYKSYSTLLVASVPVMLWDLLPENLACSFIGYVKSNNLLDRNESPISNQAANMAVGGIMRTPAGATYEEDFSKTSHSVRDVSSGEHLNMAGSQRVSNSTVEAPFSPHYVVAHGANQHPIEEFTPKVSSSPSFTCLANVWRLLSLCTDVDNIILEMLCNFSLEKVYSEGDKEAYQHLVITLLAQLNAIFYIQRISLPSENSQARWYLGFLASWEVTFRSVEFVLQIVEEGRESLWDARLLRDKYLAELLLSALRVLMLHPKASAHQQAKDRRDCFAHIHRSLERLYDSYPGPKSFLLLVCKEVTDALCTEPNTLTLPPKLRYELPSLASELVLDIHSIG